MIKLDLNLPNAAKDIDKLHRIGKVKQFAGKKVIVKFNPIHQDMWYLVRRRNKRNIKVGPKLTKSRGKLLYDVKQLNRLDRRNEFCVCRYMVI